MPKSIITAAFNIGILAEDRVLLSLAGAADLGAGEAFVVAGGFIGFAKRGNAAHISRIAACAVLNDDFAHIAVAGRLIAFQHGNACFQIGNAPLQRTNARGIVGRRGIERGGQGGEGKEEGK